MIFTPNNNRPSGTVPSPQRTAGFMIKMKRDDTCVSKITRNKEYWVFDLFHSWQISDWNMKFKYLDDETLMSIYIGVPLKNSNVNFEIWNVRTSSDVESAHCLFWITKITSITLQLLLCTCIKPLTPTSLVAGWLKLGVPILVGKKEKIKETIKEISSWGLFGRWYSAYSMKAIFYQVYN